MAADDSKRSREGYRCQPSEGFATAPTAGRLVAFPLHRVSYKRTHRGLIAGGRWWWTGLRCDARMPRSHLRSSNESGP